MLLCPRARPVKGTHQTHLEALLSFETHSTPHLFGIFSFGTFYFLPINNMFHHGIISDHDKGYYTSVIFGILLEQLYVLLSISGKR